MDANRLAAAAALTAGLLLAGCTPPPVSTDPPVCTAWDYVDRCDGWVRPIRAEFRTMERRSPPPYDLYLDPDGYYEKLVGETVVGTGEFWIACAGTGDCRDDELLFLSTTGIEWSLFISELTCSPPYVDPVWNDPPPIIMPAPPSAPPPSYPVKDQPEPEYKEPSRRERETGGETPVRRKEVRRSEQPEKQPQPRPAPADTGRVKEPRSKSDGTGR